MMLANQERQATLLLFVTGAIFANGLLVISLTAHSINVPAAALALSAFLGFLVLHVVLHVAGRKGDPLLLPLMAFLMAIGLIMLLRLKVDLFWAQLRWMALGLAAFAVTALWLPDPVSLERYKYTWGASAVILIAITALFGVDIGGNRNWIILGGVHVEPSEFAKLLIVFFLAGYLADYREVLAAPTEKIGIFFLPPLRFIAPLLSMWGLTMLMLVFQRDLGAAMLFFGTFLCLVYMASGRFSYIVMGMMLFGLGVGIAYVFVPHVHTRFAIWLYPWLDPMGAAFQVVQSLFAFGAGGMLGSGLAYGYPQLIPAVQTDFILAAIGEEMGFLGVAAVMLAFLLLAYRGFRIALAARHDFSALVAGGLAAIFTLQVFVIVAGVTKFLPLTGITLPFISYGGSSLVSNFLFTGVLHRIAQTEGEAGGHA